jgi:hypothetical protein
MVRQSPGFSLIPAAITVCVVLLIGMVATPPRYIARATFAVKWDSLVSAQDNAEVQRLRQECRMAVTAAVTGLPYSEQGIADVLDRADGFSGNPADKAALISRLHKRLRVTPAGQTDQGDLFTVETRDNNAGAAQATANWVLQGTVSKLKADIASGSGWAALHSSEKAVAGSWANISGAFLGDQIKEVKAAQVEVRGIGYGLSVLLAAMALGGFAAMIRWLQYQVEMVVVALKETAKSAARRAAIYDRSPARRRIRVTNRPILLRPLPQYGLTADLQGAGGLGNGLSQVQPIQATAPGH